MREGMGEEKQGKRKEKGRMKGIKKEHKVGKRERKTRNKVTEKESTRVLNKVARTGLFPFLYF
jgi:hypothetical protein